MKNTLKTIVAIVFVALLSHDFLKAQDWVDKMPCKTEVFLGTRTYPPGSSNPYDWECQGAWKGCSEVWIICGYE